jgi:hypothetical protein
MSISRAIWRRVLPSNKWRHEHSVFLIEVVQEFGGSPTPNDDKRT